VCSQALIGLLYSTTTAANTNTISCDYHRFGQVRQMKIFGNFWSIFIGYLPLLTTTVSDTAAAALLYNKRITRSEMDHFLLWFGVQNKLSVNYKMSFLCCSSHGSMSVAQWSWVKMINSHSATWLQFLPIYPRIIGSTR